MPSAASSVGNSGGHNDDTDIAVEFHLDEQLTPEARFAAAQSGESVRKPMTQLPAEQLRVIELSFFERKAHGDIQRSACRTSGLFQGTSIALLEANTSEGR
jgi:hypothetical protein